MFMTKKIYFPMLFLFCLFSFGAQAQVDSNQAKNDAFSKKILQQIKDSAEEGLVKLWFNATEEKVKGQTTFISWGPENQVQENNESVPGVFELKYTDTDFTKKHFGNPLKLDLNTISKFSCEKLPYQKYKVGQPEYYCNVEAQINGILTFLSFKFPIYHPESD